MLDKSLIGSEEPKQPLKCEKCGLDYDDEDNWQNIDFTGYCLDCEDGLLKPNLI